VITGWDGSDYVPEVIGWEGEKPGDGRKEMKSIDLTSLSPERYMKSVLIPLHIIIN
jgi:hypothetical protein